MANRIDLYKKTVDTLYEAYFNDALEHNVCTACAVGNILGFMDWNNLFTTTKYEPSFSQVLLQTDGIYYSKYDKECLSNIKLIEQIEKSGYSWQELAKIEFAFESAPEGKSDEDYMFNGLVAVLEVLKNIHDIEDEASLENVKRFETHYQTLTNH